MANEINIDLGKRRSLKANIGVPGYLGKGDTGTGIESITYKGEDEAGGYMYTVLLTDGTSYDITAPKGAAGADGITPHIGDNGNWYLGETDTGKPSRGETGLQGPQGEKGEDAAADHTLGLTGATVGQIAKITAVDDTGKPTAWAPADMPSGGSSDEMRVIKTITITAADVNSIYFNRDDNGLPFALTKHIRIRMYGAATNTGGTKATLFFRAGQTTGDVSQNFYPIRVNAHEGNYFFDFVWDLYSAINCWYGDYASARAGTADLFRYVPNESNNSPDITVREIKLAWSIASVFFQQGATIVVEGMK